jgi:hypothetical protein
MNDAQREIAEQVRAMIPRLVDKRVSSIREDLIAEVLRRIDFESLSDDVLEMTSKRISVFGGSSLIPRINADTVDFLAPNAGNTVQNLAGSGGASLVGFLPSGIGAVAGTVQAELRSRAINAVTQFGLSTGGTGAANVIALNNALAAGLAQKQAVYIPGATANYQFNAAISVPVGTTLFGDGKVNTILEFTGTGNGLISSTAINTIAEVNIAVSGLGLTTTNGANIGGGFVVEGGGNYVNLTYVKVTGFKYGAVFDQAELADIDLCEFKSCITGGVWLVNGADRRLGTSTFFTNRISIKRSQFNSNLWGIINDGGHAHTFENNNFNGGTNHIRMSGVTSGRIINNDLEGATGINIVFNTNTLAGGAVGASFCSIEDNFFVPAAGINAGSLAGGGAIVLKNNYHSTTVAAWANSSLPATVIGISNYNPAGALYDSAVGSGYVVEMDVTTIPKFGNLAQRRFSPAYGLTVAIDASLGNFGELVATNGTAFTISNPTNGRNGQALTITISNTSGGALGVITWGVNYKMSAWTSPATANNRSITFVYDGTNWNERSRTAADVPN